jgi:adenosylcobinamide-GDP ribazoletransferase
MTMIARGQRLSPRLQMVRQEAAYGLTAIQFLTRLRVPHLHNFERSWLDRSVAYFPLVGMIVAGISSLVLVVAAIIWPNPIPALLAVCAGVLVTGALHEDGLADSADGLAGGHTPAQRLAIMRDSRIGTFGAIAVMFALGLKVACLGMLTPFDGVCALFAAHMGARAACVVAAAFTPYVGDTEGKTGPLDVRGRRLAFAVVVGLAGFLGLPFMPALAALLIAGFAAVCFLRVAASALGGHNGDVLGATEQIFEVVVLLVLTGYAT